MLQKLNEIELTPWDVLLVSVTKPIDGRYEFLFFVDSVGRDLNTGNVIYLGGFTYWDYNRIPSRAIMAQDIVGVKLITRDQLINGVLLNLVSERNQFEDKMKSLEAKTS